LKALRRRPVAVALVCQVLAGIVLRALGGLFETSLPFYPALFLQGSLAAVLGHFLGLPRWWIAINILLPPAVGYALTWGLPSWVYLAAFIALVAVFWNSGRDRVPFYLTNKKTAEALLTLIPSDRAINFIDIGCATGGLLLHLAARRPQAQFVGVESAPLPYLIACARLAASGRANVTLRRIDLWKQDLSEFDMAYAFLSSDPMAKLFAKATDEMPAGALFISNSFTPPDFPPERTLDVGDRRRTRLHLWRMPGTRP
jgi:predicted O-methyltransferase YrrM